MPLSASASKGALSVIARLRPSVRCHLFSDTFVHDLRYQYSGWVNVGAGLFGPGHVECVDSSGVAVAGV